MNILLCAEDFVLNGVTRHIIDLANGLAQKGHFVVVAATPSGEERRLDAAVIFVPLSLCRESSYKKKYYGIFSSILALLRTIRTHQIQILHTHKRYADAIGRIVARITGTLHISTCHNEFDTYARYSFFGVITIAPCETIAWMLIEQFHRSPGSIRIIPYGIQELERYSSSAMSDIKCTYGIAPTDTIVLSVGHLNRQKDRQTLVGAIQLVRKAWKGKNVIFLIVGEGEDESRVRSMIQQYHLEHMIKILPPRSNISALNNIADFCVLSSIHETWSYVLLEAASVGKPFIATSVGCIPSFIADNTTGICVPPKNSARLSEAIIDFLEHPEIIRQKGECARKRFEQYHAYDVFIARMIELYQQTLYEK
jgi:glycosyltransferase involved in cell wall biosynthesis